MPVLHPPTLRAGGHDVGSPLLDLRGISKRFGGVTALSGADFTLMPGEVHGLVGENGAGKSTMMKIIAGVHAEYEGVMRVGGVPVRFRSARDAIAAGIGMVHQELSIVAALTVAENVALGKQPVNRLGMVDWRAMVRQAEKLLGDLGIEADPRASAGSLPLGLQQMVELARVLSSGARILILDEPTSALSPPEVETLFGLLGRLRATGRGIVFISHFLDDVLRVSDRVTVFRGGRVIETAPVTGPQGGPKGGHKGGPKGGMDKAWIIQRMIGAGHENLAESYTGEIQLGNRSSGPVVLRAEGLASAGAFRDVSLELRAGEVLGIYGFMGAGQLDLARALFGKLALDQGRVEVAGQPVRLRNTTAAKRAGIAFVPESRRAMLFAGEPVFKNVSIAILARISRLLLRPGVERAIAAGHVERLHIRPPAVDRPLGTLSGGNQQKVALAKWLTHLPKLLMLSEPTRGMDVGAKDDVVQIVRSLRDQGVGVLVVSTEPETVLSLADRILVMRRGAVTGEFAAQAVSKDRLLAAA